jgi:F0F1-type ATP synthase alpha subunit
MITNKKVKKPSEDYGIISRVDGGIIYITGLYRLSVGEIVYFGRNMEQAITLNLERNIAKAAIFGTNENVAQGTPVFRTFRLMKVSISPQLLGKVIDCLGNSLSDDFDKKNTTTISRTVDVKALGVIDRKSINEPLVTGVLSIDAMLPIGRGQRELIIGDRQLGKTSLAIDSIISQKNLHISE